MESEKKFVIKRDGTKAEIKQQRIRERLQGAPAQDWDRVLLVGDAPYYSRFGFEPLSGVVMPPPTNPKRVLGLPLVANGWIGIVGSVSSMRS